MWSENLLFAVWDPNADVAMWLHLGTVPGQVDDVGGPGARDAPGSRRRAVAARLSPHRTGATSGRTRPGVPSARAVAAVARELRRLRAPHARGGDAGRASAATDRRKPFAVDLDIECVTPGMGRAHGEPARVGCRRHGEPELGQRALRAARARHGHRHARDRRACRSSGTAGATTRAGRATRPRSTAGVAT